ncbi:histidine kinase [Algoriphagus sp.]|uniref:sensor histidine kinase n=1 Tax=Algoriphagus sp. TaxID=1872435 RepID=UPI00262558A9|nr:histidine kinase [Algoriphagus sp.]
MNSEAAVFGIHFLKYQEMYSVMMTVFVFQTTSPKQENSEIFVALLVGLVPVLLAFLFLFFVIYRSRREAVARAVETQIRLSKAEGELKALRAQINPHFIFNCLNSIHHFIQQQDAKLAGEYLIKFSKLIRYVLESSAKNWVTLAEELEANELYLELEQLRTGNAFQFDFEVDPRILKDQTYIPPMLIQPFLENAVWHGLSQEGKVRLQIQSNGGAYLHCKIADEGMGKIEKPDYDLSKLVKKSSMGIQLMKERFKVLNEWKGFQAKYEFKDLQGGGREVLLTIPFEVE